MVGRDQYPVQHIGVEHTGLRHGGEGQSDDDFIDAGAIVARKAEDVVEVGGTYIDVRKDRIYGVRIVMVCHNCALPVLARAKEQPSTPYYMVAEKAADVILAS